MTKIKLFAATALAASALAVVAIAPAIAADLTGYPHHRHHHHYRHAYWSLPYPISYMHNYGPGLMPGSFAYYDGSTRNKCYQGSAAYIGQDGRRHPCF
ncbi:hypothetical protein JQ615_28160 [Bradyrhizobium jicamae]|uniref:Lectin-like protein BA14k n=1 Tax=Bradyrhizobium jicamae TaxID=280332 RepID=A0ABS5FR95_9BRAD|nr:hypothetical protein [Bradyrhizobium jicamae]MBR0799271.1 hypothetical protein [Bradyrhizobium jicamae]